MTKEDLAGWFDNVKYALEGNTLPSCPVCSKKVNEITRYVAIDTEEEWLASPFSIYGASVEFTAWPCGCVLTTEDES